MKKLLAICLLLLAHPSHPQAFETPSEVTFDWLVKTGDDDGGSDHVICMKEIFQAVKPRSLLEFGLGYSTKYLLDSCKRVISVEVVTNGYGPNRIKKFIQFYRDFSNWVPIAYFSGVSGDMSWAPYKYLGSDAVYTAASYQCATNLHYAPIDDFYLKELGEFISNLIKFNRIEVALIHPLLYLRGDLVELCFQKIPVIVAHNTVYRARGQKNDPFGFSRIVTPPEYVEIYIPTRQGTTVWIYKEPKFEELINNLSKLQPQ